MVCKGAEHTLQVLLLLLLFMSCSLQVVSKLVNHIAVFLGPAPTGTWTIALDPTYPTYGSFPFIRTSFFGESV
jgi:hypothetical protein